MKNKSFFKSSVFCMAVAGVSGAAVMGYAFLGSSDGPSYYRDDVNKVNFLADRGDLLDGEWSYMPGTNQEKRGLRILDRDFVIVEQDGSGGQPNPPINLFGTHASVDGDFEVAIRVNENNAQQASLRLYGELPLIFDEFRIERQSLELKFTPESLVITQMGSAGQQLLVQHKPLSAVTTATLNIERNDGLLSVSLNGTEIAAFPDQGIFSSGEVWFGASSQGGSWLLSDLDIKSRKNGHLAFVDSSKLKVKTHEEDGLQFLLDRKRPDFLIGSAAALAPAVSDKEYAELLFGGNFGLITTENALKWQFVHPGQDAYEFGEADALVRLARRHGLAVHGHTLVFGEANPRWVQELPEVQVEQSMLDHIKTVVGHYRGDISSWDVVNEPFDDETWSGLRPHIWYKAIGESYIAKAFRAAHDADPDAELFMNEYGLEEDGERWDAMLVLLKKLLAQDVPIDGVGFQSHVYEAADRIDGEVLREHIEQLDKLGLKARVSEMDVYSGDGQDVQAQQYADVLKVCAEEPNCASFTVWIPSDRYNKWRDDDGSIQDGQDAPWGADMQPTPAAERMLQVLSRL